MNTKQVVLVTPKDFYGAMMELIKERRGTDIEVQYLEEKNQVLLTAFIPWQEVVCDMNDQVINSLQLILEVEIKVT
jgi:translation elongation factor EF-4